MTPPEIPARYELKYTISAAQAEGIRQHIRAFCRLDSASARAPRHRYRITSVYLDTAGLRFHKAKIDRERRRLKLRVRTYEGGPPEAPVFAEVKRRIGDIIKKTRAPLRTNRWCDDLLGPPRTRAAADFEAVRALHQARPTLLCRYDREAWVSDIDDYARLTFDFALCHQPVEAYRLAGDPSCWRAADDPSITRTGRLSPIILELKFAQRAPGWMQQLVRRFDLTRRGFSKYCAGVEQLFLTDRHFDRYERQATDPLGALKGSRR